MSDSQTTPRVTVIVPVYNDPQRLRLCLDALAEQDFPRDRFDVIVVDNGSQDPPRELVEGYPFGRFAEESATGSYAARNKGLTLATGDVIAFTDSDCLPQPGWLTAGVEAVTGDKHVGLVGGRIEVFPQDTSAPTSVELYDCLFGLDQEANVKQFHFAATANAFTRCDVLKEVGVFNQTLKSGGDLEWGQRVSQAGYGVVWAPDALVRHPARKLRSQLLTQARRHAGGRIDKSRDKGRSLVRWGALRNAIALLLPPFGKMATIARGVRGRGHGWMRVASVWRVLFAVRYAILYAKVVTALGRPSERK